MTNPFLQMNSPQGHKSRFVLIGISLFVALSAWAFSSPVASSPDDDFHLGSIWCADGLNTELCTTQGETIPGSKTPVVIPAVGEPCFARDPNKSAHCQQDFQATDKQASFANTGLYPNAFYEFQNLFISEQAADSVLRMRLANAFLFIGFFMLALVLSSKSNRLLLGLVFLLTSVPMGVFIIPSTNPSSWLYIAITVNWAFQTLTLSSNLTRSRKSVLVASVAMFISGILALESRSDGKIYLLISICLTYALLGKQIRLSNPWSHCVPFALIAISLFKFSADSSFSGFGTPGGGQNLDSTQYLFTTIVRAIEVPFGNLGFLAPGGSLGILGWLDTPIPPLVPLLTIGLLASWTFLLYQSGTWIKRLSFWSTCAFLVLIPAFFLYSGKNLVGENVQPRYVIPLLPLFVLAAVGINRNFDEISRLILNRILFTAILISFANGISLMANINRYTLGSGSFGVQGFSSAALWWWPNLISPLYILLLGFLGYFVFAYLLLIMFKDLKDKEAASS